MVGLMCRVFDRGDDVFLLKRRVIRQDFLERSARRQELEDVGHANAQAANARSAAAFPLFHRNPFQPVVVHSFKITCLARKWQGRRRARGGLLPSGACRGLARVAHTLPWICAPRFCHRQRNTLRGGDPAGVGSPPSLKAAAILRPKEGAGERHRLRLPDTSTAYLQNDSSFSPCLSFSGFAAGDAEDFDRSPKGRRAKSTRSMLPAFALVLRRDFLSPDQRHTIGYACMRLQARRSRPPGKTMRRRWRPSQAAKGGGTTGANSAQGCGP